MIEQYDRTRYDTEEVRKLLSMAIGHPSREFLTKLPDMVYEISGHLLFVAVNKDQAIGIIGVDITLAPHAWILHLAVHPEFRNKGIGRAIINELMEKLSLTSLALETDQDAAGFYRACGFETIEIISKWPRVHRYLCTKGQAEKSVIEYYHKRKLPG